jgi:hypothetical protein
MTAAQADPRGRGLVHTLTGGGVAGRLGLGARGLVKEIKHRVRVVGHPTHQRSSHTAR